MLTSQIKRQRHPARDSQSKKSPSLYGDPLIRPFLAQGLYRSMQYAAWLMALFVPVIVWPSNPLRIPGRAEFASGYSAAVVALWLFLGLMESVPETFKSLWLRGALASPAPRRAKTTKGRFRPPEQPFPYQQLGPKYEAFVEKFESALNSRGQWWLAGLFAALALGWYLILWKGTIFRTLILLVGATVEPLIGFMLGLMAWRMLVVGWEISALARHYKVSVLVTHPDGCGGLAPLGNLCLLNALIIATAGVHLGIWSLIKPGYQFSGLIAVPLALSAFAFILPMLSTHIAMENEKRAIQTQLDELSHRIHDEDRRLLEAGDYIEPSRGEKWLEQLELMSKLFDQHRTIPAWPVNWSIFGKFLAAEAVPVLSLVGLPKSILDILQAFVSTSKP